MSKLTLKDWLLYNNALLKYDKSLIFNISFNEAKATGIGRVNIVRFGDNQVQLLDNDIVVWTEFENCKLILREQTDLTVLEEGVLKAKCMYEQSMGGGLVELVQAYGKGRDYLCSINVDMHNFIKKNKAVKQ